MSRPVRVIVMNVEEEATAELRSHLLGIDGVKIVAEIDEPGLLGQALDQFPAEVLLVHLDPNPNGIMEAIAPQLTARKDQLVVIAMTEDRDAELVVRAMRLGMREFLWKPFPPEQLSEILNRVQREAPAGTRRLGRLVPVVGTCGGVGATTLAINLGVELAQADNWKDASGGLAKPRVAIVDLDFRFGQVAMFLDCQPTYTVAELCDTAEHIEAQMIERVMIKHSSGAHVLAHPANLEQAQRISAAQCAGALGALLEHYDFVVVDGPVRFDPMARSVFDLADFYLFVMQLVVPSVRNTDRMMTELTRSGFNTGRVRLICNRFGREAGYLEPHDVEATLGRKISWTLPDDWKTSSTAVNVGAPLADYSPKSKLRLGYRQIALAIAAGATAEDADPEETPAQPDLKKGGLRKFFGSKQTVAT